MFGGAVWLGWGEDDLAVGAVYCDADGVVASGFEAVRPADCHALDVDAAVLDGYDHTAGFHDRTTHQSGSRRVGLAPPRPSAMVGQGPTLPAIGGQSLPYDLELMGAGSGQTALLQNFYLTKTLSGV